VARRIFAEIDVLDAPFFDVTDLGAGKFRLDAPPVLEGAETKWTVDGDLVAAGAYAPLEIDASGLGAGEHEVRLVANHPTPLVRIWADAIREEMSVTVTVP
jgi:hypothetical protein